MQHHETPLNMIGTIFGAIGGITATAEVSTVIQAELISLLHIAVGAFVGAVIGFFTTMFLKWLFKKKE